jgi:hypothetical protein
MRKILLLLPFFLWTCGGGGSPTEPEVPLAYNLSLTTNEDTALTFTFEDISSSSTISISRNTKNGTLTLSGSSATYTPNNDFNGTDTFSYIVVENGLNSNAADAEITVLPVNDAPTMEDTIVNEMFNNKTVQFQTNINDIDSDNFSLSLLTQPKNGYVTFNNNTVIYTATSKGEESFNIQASDGELNSNIAEVAITIIDDFWTSDYSPIGSRVKEKNDTIIIAGTNLNGYSYDKSLTMIDSQGNILLQQELDFHGQLIQDLIITDSNDLYISGRGPSSSNYEGGYFAKMDLNFSVQWEKEFYNSGGDGQVWFVYDFLELENEEILVTGRDNTTNRILHYSSNGSLLNHYTAKDSNGNVNYQRSKSISIIKKNNIFIISHINGDIFELDLSNDTYDVVTNIGDGWINSFEKINDGGFIVSGIEGSGSPNHLIKKLDSSYNVEWESSFDSGSNNIYYYRESFAHLTVNEVQTIDNDIYVMAYFRDAPSSERRSGVIVKKFDINGNVEWSEEILFKQNMYPSSFTISSNNELIISGHYEEYLSSMEGIEGNMIIIKIDSQGNIIN